MTGPGTPNRCDRHRALAVLALLTVSAGCGPERTDSQLLVGAAVSLQAPLETAARLYRDTDTDAQITFSFSGSGTLVHQARFGAPLDIVITASSSYMDSLASAGIVSPDDRVPLWGNAIVLVSHVRRSPLSAINDLDLPGVRTIAVGDPATVPAGAYAVQALTALGLWEDLRQKCIYTRDVRQVLTYVESGVVDAGFVYRTDAQTSRHVDVVAEVADSLHAPIRYEAAAVGRTRGTERARGFIRFLGSDTVQSVFRHHGFVPLDR